MKVQLTTGPADIFVSHEAQRQTPEHVVRRHGINAGSIQRGTKIGLRLIPNADEIQVTAWCSPGDNFCRRLGLNKALIKLFKQAKIGKDDQRLLKNQIFGGHKK